MSQNHPIAFEWEKFECEVCLWKDLKREKNLESDGLLNSPDDNHPVIFVDLQKKPLEKSKITVQLGTVDRSIKELKSLAKLGYLWISNPQNKVERLTQWVKKNGLPLYSAALPFQIFAQECPSIISQEFQRNWLFSYSAQMKYPSYFIMTSFALSALAIEASVVYLELVRSIKEWPSILACKDPMQRYKETGEYAFFEKLTPNDNKCEISIPPSAILPPVFLLLFQSTEWQVFYQNLYTKNISSTHKANDYTDFLHKSLIKISRAYRHHIAVDIAQSGASRLKDSGSMISVSNWLGLAWLELYSLLTQSDYSKLRVCGYSSCRAVFEANRSDKEYCSEDCQRSAERARRHVKKNPAPDTST
ncbi:MAG: hypothetical protein P4N59_11800 [Negativicutes bacterium]|nr:hypothetical protein [Negativicutes bacterium]